MNMLYYARVSAFALVLAVAASLPQSSFAVPITTMDGVIGDFDLSAVGGSGVVTLSINNIATFTSQHNGTLLGGPLAWNTTTFTPAVINIDANGQPAINFDVTKTISGGVDLLGNPVSNSAQFDANLNVVTVTPVAMIIQGDEVLASNTSNLDLSLFAVGSLVMTFNSPNPGSIVNLFQHAVSGTGTMSLSGSGSFSQSNVPFSVPEPASITVWLIAGVALLGMARCICCKTKARR